MTYAQTHLEDRLLPVSEVVRITGIARGTIYRHMQRRTGNGFPLPVKIGRRSLWRASDIQAWMAQLAPAS